MNKTKIEYGDYCWNPYEGCLNECWYCWAKKGKDRLGGNMKPKYYPERLKDPMKEKPGRVVVCFWGDLFGNWVDGEFIEKVINKTKGHPEHTFIFLTKFPSRYRDFKFPGNCWLGCSIDGTVKTQDLYSTFGYLVKPNIKFISFEPLLSEPTWEHIPMDIQWIIVGGLTPAPKHDDEWVDNLIAHCRETDTAIFLKDNLHYPIKIQEFPHGKSSTR